MEIQYLGEHLLPGYLGQFSVVLAFISSIIASIFYWQASVKNESDGLLWNKWGRRVFYFHAILIILACFFLLFILLNHYYEYKYVWTHMENNLGIGYKIAALWAGQEGSLLFWALCQVLFGIFITRKGKGWEPRVMTIVGVSQVFMVSLLLGFKIGNFTLGSDPFILLRNSAENLGSSFFQNPMYVNMINDGNGLNPLLRNFWMLSHPPVLFLGYAATLIPFSFAIAGLWSKKYTAWIKPALPWTVLAAFFLGAGILLGGVWAYESLTFGGFWAWDPVENASLVPWLVLVAALHLMLVARKKNFNLFPAFLFVILSFVLVIYATFLTRSGVLSETSVHSFGNDGTGRLILIYLLVFLAWGLFLLFKNLPHLPDQKNENIFTREFWLFAGSLILILSAFQIIFSTSLPVVNAMFGTNLAPPLDVAEYYNSWQLPFAVVIGLLIALVHFISWGRNDSGRFIKAAGFSFFLSVIFLLPIIILMKINDIGHVLMLFASLFALFSSLDILFRFGKKTSRAAAVTHLGMALFMVSVLITFSQKEIISSNTSGYSLGKSLPESENLLMVKNEILPMGEYWVNYTGNRTEGERIIYNIDFLKKNDKGEYYKAFSSEPSVLVNEKMGNVYEPYAKVNTFADVFTYITYTDLQKTNLSEENIIKTFEIKLKDTVEVKGNKLIFKHIDSPSSGEEIDPENIKIDALLEIESQTGEVYNATPSFILDNGYLTYKDDIVEALNLVLRFKNVTEKPYTIQLEVYDHQPEFIVVKTVIFPFINLLWISCLIILSGLLLSFRNRRKLNLQK